MSKILHITESYGGGVKTAISSFAKNSSENTHYLLATNSRSKNKSVLIKNSDLFEESEQLAFSLDFLPFLGLEFLKLEAQLNRVARDFCPDFIHLHSSFAGIIGRLFVNKFKKYNKNVKVIYSPHCYAFERKDISNFMQKVYFKIEKFFAKRTDIFALCSKREVELTKHLTSESQTIFIPNVSALEFDDKTEKANRDDQPEIIAIGRDSKQKNYQFLEQLKYDVQILDGLSQKELANKITSAKLYLICSLWEGFPISILDAIKGGLPIVALNCEYLDNESPREYIFNDSEEADLLIEKLLKSPELREKCHQNWQQAYIYCKDEEQSKALAKLYIK